MFDTVSGPSTIWLTGLSASGKTTLATGLEALLVAEGRSVFRLDGDVLRAGLNKDLDFSTAGRSEAIRRAAEVARLMNAAGVVVIAALISPLHADRLMARSIIGVSRFCEVYVSTPLAVCEARDPKGLYRRARAGEIKEFTGISAPYEAPSAPHCNLDTSTLSLDACLAILRALVP